MTYSAFIRRAEKRMLGLREKLKEAPFLKEHGVDGMPSSSRRKIPTDLLGAAGAGSLAHP